MKNLNCFKNAGNQGYILLPRRSFRTHCFFSLQNGSIQVVANFTRIKEMKATMLNQNLPILGHSLEGAEVRRVA